MIKLPAIGNRPILILTLSALVASAGLIGGTVTNSSSETENPSSFVAGTLVLSNTVESDVPCVSSAAILRCTPVLGATLAPGKVASSHVTLQNVGVVPVGALAFWVADCQSQNSLETAFHGTRDLCTATQVTIHDDVHDHCYYPAPAASGPCAFAIGATLGDLVAQHSRGTLLDLTSDHLGGGITYTLSTRIDPSVGNEAQGRQAGFTLVWQATQAS